MANHPFPPKVRYGLDPQVLDTLNFRLLSGGGERDEELRAAVDGLPDRERLVVEMCFWQQVPKREIARRLGVSRAVVNTLLQRALESLGETLRSRAR